jgi:hypothetical protein
MLGGSAHGRLARQNWVKNKTKTKNLSKTSKSQQAFRVLQTPGLRNFYSTEQSQHAGLYPPGVARIAEVISAWLFAKVICSKAQI